MSGLSALETKAYIKHHLRLAGVKHALFSDEAVAVICHFSKGIPRKINNICTACLLDGFLQEKSIIDETIARRAPGSSKTIRKPARAAGPSSSASQLEQIPVK
ncbi:hypothetical protein [Thermodesulfitimonas autotrophica]|uniref:hypothetical protein n=1 Tax=Thermodesulfitimonas autotrophica TaxID=1894989 RepID=UPI002FE22090